jgi:hypothetical protein
MIYPPCTRASNLTAVGFMLALQHASNCATANHHLMLILTPGLRPFVNSTPAASSTCRRLSIVRLRIASPRSNLTTVCGDTFAAIANFLMLRPKPALAIRHCTGSTLSTLNGTTFKGCYIEMLVVREGAKTTVNAPSHIRGRQRVAGRRGAPRAVGTPRRIQTLGGLFIDRRKPGCGGCKPGLLSGSPLIRQACWFQTGPFSSNGCRSL